MDFFKALLIFDLVLSSNLETDRNAKVPISFTDSTSQSIMTTEVYYRRDGLQIYWVGTNSTETLSREWNFTLESETNIRQLQMVDRSSARSDKPIEVIQNFDYQQGNLSSVQGNSRHGIAFRFRYLYTKDTLSALQYNDVNGGIRSSWSVLFHYNDKGLAQKMEFRDENWSVKHDTLDRITEIEVATKQNGPRLRKSFRYEGNSERIASVTYDYLREESIFATQVRRYEYGTLKNQLEKPLPFPTFESAPILAAQSPIGSTPKWALGLGFFQGGSVQYDLLGRNHSEKGYVLQAQPPKKPF